ncbi:MAG: hypothetical protein KIS66_13010 [Fimbriimonadaceae bacterium]|nr:hypothetical protein [Fimbriimonadaceae bacterium]
MIAAFLLATSALAQSQSVSWDTLIFPVTPLFGYDLPFTSSCHDVSGRLLSAPDDPLTAKQDRQGHDWLKATIIRTKEDGDRAITRLIRIETYPALTTIVAVKGLRPGVNYLTTPVPIVYGDVFTETGPNRKHLPPDDKIDERDVKMVDDLVRVGGRNGAKYTDWQITYNSSWILVDVNGDRAVDERDVAIVRANLGKMAPKLELVPPSRGGPKLYGATQKRPNDEPFGGRAIGSFAGVRER